MQEYQRYNEAENAGISALQWSWKTHEYQKYTTAERRTNISSTI
jgi:hypothetical protein